MPPASFPGLRTKSRRRRRVRFRKDEFIVQWREFRGAKDGEKKKGIVVIVVSRHALAAPLTRHEMARRRDSAMASMASSFRSSS